MEQEQTLGYWLKCPSTNMATYGTNTFRPGRAPYSLLITRMPEVFHFLLVLFMSKNHIKKVKYYDSQLSPELTSMWTGVTLLHEMAFCAAPSYFGYMSPCEAAGFEFSNLPHLPSSNKKHFQPVLGVP